MRVVIILIAAMGLPLLNFAKTPGKGDAKARSSQLIKKMGVPGFGDPMMEIYRRPAGQPSVQLKNDESKWGLIKSQSNQNSPFQLYRGQLAPSAEGTPYFFAD